MGLVLVWPRSPFAGRVAALIGLAERAMQLARYRELLQDCPVICPFLDDVPRHAQLLESGSQGEIRTPD